MQLEIEDVYAIIKANYPGAGVDADGIMLVPYEGMTISFVDLPNDPTSLLIRMKVLSLDSLKRPGDFAKAVLAGNFFYQGGRGTAMTVGEDNCLYLTECRLIESLLTQEAVDKCFAEYVETANGWRMRSRLYA